MLNKLWPNSKKIGISKKDVHIKMQSQRNIINNNKNNVQEQIKIIQNKLHLQTILL